jgi:TerC family integral membrane protein
MTTKTNRAGALRSLFLALLILGIADAFVSRSIAARKSPLHFTKNSLLNSPNPQRTHCRSQRIHVVQQKGEHFLESSVVNGSDVDVSGAVTTAIVEEDDSKFKLALQRTLLWVGAACAFGAGLFVFVDSKTCEEFFAGYLLEQSLSVDNLLVFLLLFEYFQIPKEYENRILNWGIIGAVIMRATMIGAGAVAIQQFHGVLLVFAAILIYSSAKVLLGSEEDEEEDLSENQIIQFSNKVISSTSTFDGDRFFTIVDGVRKATPIFLCMVAVEISDVVFAVDSIPAVFGVTNVRF